VNGHLQWFHFYDFADDINMTLFEKDEILTDPRYQNRNITFHTSEDDLSRLDYKIVHKGQQLPELAIHCEYQLLFKLLPQVCPELYQRLSKYGYDTIEDIKYYCRFEDADKRFLLSLQQKSLFVLKLYTYEKRNYR